MPFLRPNRFNLFGLIFCSVLPVFTIVLTLGGGPKYTTLEVAIYQAITFDFDIETAALLAFVNFCSVSPCSVSIVSLVINRVKPPQARCYPINRYQRCHHYFILITATLFIISLLLETLGRRIKCPSFMATVVTSGVMASHCFFSLLLAPTAALLCLLLTISLLTTATSIGSASNAAVNGC